MIQCRKSKGGIYNEKIIALALTAAMAMPCAVNAQAADRMSGIYESTKDHSEIHILYNDTVVQYEDVKPVNTDGRVMIPFPRGA